MKNFIFFSAIFLAACGGRNATADPQAAGGAANGAAANSTSGTQLNLTLLLDLSDRIDPATDKENPSHAQRDTAIINYFTNYFLKEMERKGTYQAKGKMRVIFSPKPADPNINTAAEKLNIDLSAIDVKDKKAVYDKLAATVFENVADIYRTAIESKKWIGSDIWRFFKNDVKDYAIDRDRSYRNILVILTDGYIYHADSKDKKGNRYAYMLPSLLDQMNLRKNGQWEKTIEEKDFGLISTRSDLENLEVLVLEVTPSASHKNDEDIIKNVLSKWFDEMKVSRYDVYNSDLPSYTKKRIDNFMNKDADSVGPGK